MASDQKWENEMWTFGRLRDYTHISHSAFCFLRFVLAADNENHLRVMIQRGNRSHKVGKAFRKLLAIQDTIYYKAHDVKKH